MKNEIKNGFQGGKYGVGDPEANSQPPGSHKIKEPSMELGKAAFSTLMSDALRA